MSDLTRNTLYLLLPLRLVVASSLSTSKVYRRFFPSPRCFPYAEGLVILE